MIYRYCKVIIEKGHYEEHGMMEKINVLFLADQLTKDEFNDLMSMLLPKEAD